MKPNQPDIDSSKTPSAWIKWVVVAGVSLCGSVIVHLIEGNLQSKDLVISIAGIVGTAFVPFAVAMLVAVFIRGWVGVWVGATIAVVIIGLMSLGSNLESKPKKDLLGHVSKELKETREEARTQLEKAGRMNVDPTRVQNVLATMTSSTRYLSPTDSNGIAALTVVTTPIVKCSEEGQKIGLEISNQEFLNPTNLHSRAEIEARLNRLEEYKLKWRSFITLYQNVDVALKSELLSRGITPLQAKETTESFIKSSRPDIGIPLAQCNVSHADALAHQFNLLKDNYGHWWILDNKLTFENERLIGQWNDAARELFRIAENREALERKLLIQSNSKSK